MLTSHGRHRYEELDSLRGVAAMTVVFWHASNFFNPPLPEWWKLLLSSPVGIALSGPDAVYVFFVLSGFVLFLPHLREGGADPYGKFLVKRVCRIYLPYLVALGLAIAADLLFYRPGIHAMFPRWVNWPRPFSVSAVWLHIAFLWDARLDQFNPAFWTLVYEMRLSILFPLIAWLAKRLRLGVGSAVGLAMCAAGFWLSDHVPVAFALADWKTLGYGGLFVLGALLARHLPQVRAGMEAIGGWGRAGVLALAVFLFKATHLLPERLYQYWTLVPLHGSGAALVVVLAMTTVHFRRMLHSAALRWLGKVSYSLYLVHGVVLYSVVSLFWVRTRHHVPLMAAAMALAVAVSGPMYRWVERPALLLGRRLTRG
jgi:peptidoglycan/LPS O-acetylase OafA/YrhL